MVKTQENGLHLLYKKLGETPNESIARFKVDNPEYKDTRMTYAGRLDPMAEGLLLVLSGKKVNEKDAYLNLSKTYTFQMLWGFETDAQDMLGVVNEKLLDTECLTKIPNEMNIRRVLEKSVGKFEQAYPPYSSKPVLGSPLQGSGEIKKPLWQWAREGRIGEVRVPKHEVEIHNVRFISRHSISNDELLKSIEQKISLVSGDFRQKEIIEKWQVLMSKMPFDIRYVIDQMEMTVSSGFYVRQFVSDFSAKFGLSAVTFHIKRDKIGDFCV